jgi:hypothetical protein
LTFNASLEIKNIVDSVDNGFFEAKMTKMHLKKHIWQLQTFSKWFLFCVNEESIVMCQFTILSSHALLEK